MPAMTTTELIRDRGLSVIDCDIPARMTFAQFRKRPQVAPASPWKLGVRLLRGER